MQRGMKLILLLVVLVLAVGGYLVVSHFAAESEGTDDAAVSVASFSGDDVTALRFGPAENTLTLERDGDVWRYAGDPDVFPLNQSIPEKMLGAVAEITASRVIEDPEDLAEYGLDTPGSSLTVTTADGGGHSFAFGDTNDVTGEIYMLADGDASKVYLVSSDLPDAFSYSLCDMAQKETLPVFGTVRGVSVSTGGKTLQLSYEEQNGNLAWTDYYHWFLEDGATYLPLDTEKVSSLYKNVTGLVFLSCVSYNADDDTLAGYGLGDGAAALVTLQHVTTDSVDTGETDADGNAVTEQQTSWNTFTLRIGNRTDDGYYAALSGSRMVYLIDTDAAEALLTADYASLRPDRFCRMDWDTVTSMDVTLSGETYTISFDGTQDVEVSPAPTEGADASSDDTQTQTANGYTCGGTALDADAVESFLDCVSGLVLQEEAGSVSAGTPEIGIVIHRNASVFPTLTLTLSPLGSDQALAVFQGESLLVSRESEENLLAAAQHALGLN
ncbi:MAG TPA: DUF4340 domain-containing protein [Oscillospiraceae bacterium]|nr:DUF4340 domain-containing protein [Oscillospiraceae bacterium]